jgi:glycerophosphoryl diester phosphodiesterase
MMARFLILAILVCGSASAQSLHGFDLQGHRGYRARWPENTWVGMKAALEAGVTTLEMDVVISKDRQVVLSHEPWMNTEICGTSTALNLYQLDYAQIRSYDCGSPKGHPRFPKQQIGPSPKPLLSEIFDSVRVYCDAKGRVLPLWNIEIKSRAEWDGVFHPHPEEYVRLVLDVVAASGMKDRCMIQSFDRRIPRWVYAVDSTLELVVLEEYRRTPFKTRVAQRSLGDVGLEVGTYSPHYRMVTRRLVRRMHQRGIRVVPWTVNEPRTMCGLVQKGVDGLITDDPGIFMELKHPRAGQTP